MVIHIRNSLNLFTKNTYKNCNFFTPFSGITSFVVKNSNNLCNFCYDVNNQIYFLKQSIIIVLYLFLLTFYKITYTKTMKKVFKKPSVML